jgi:molecular chaperone HscC
MVRDNLLLGRLTVKGIPPGPPGQLVDVRLTYDLNGVLEVEATVVATRRKVSTVISKLAKGGMSAADIRDAVEAMQGLKAHPREEADNRYLLRRAERLYAELPEELRDRLGELLDGFEGALTMQDAAAISANREALREFLDRYDPDAADDPDEDA